MKCTFVAGATNHDIALTPTERELVALEWRRTLSTWSVRKVERYPWAGVLILNGLPREGRRVPKITTFDEESVAQHGAVDYPRGLL